MNDDQYMRDAKGRLVPLALVRPIDQARHQVVLELIDEARELSERLAAFKARALGDVEAFVSLSAEQYQVELGGAKGNLTLTSYDGRFRIIRQTQDRLVFDERLQVAKELVDRCIREWASNATDKIQALVTHAFQVDRAGKVSTERVLGLRKLDIDDARWTQAMTAIADSVTVASSATYLRFYERVGDDGDVYRPISLDLSTL